MDDNSQQNGTMPPPDYYDRFNYSLLSDNVANKARAVAENIRHRQGSNMVEIGQDLIAIKDQLEHGHFCAWLNDAVGMSERSAENYMNTARFLAGKSATVADLPPTILYALCTRSAPSSIVDEIVAEVDNGARLNLQEVRGRFAAAREIERQMKVEANKSVDQIAKDLRSRKSREQRDKRRAAEEQKEEKELENRERERVEKLGPLAEHIASTVESDYRSKLVEALRDYALSRTLLRLLVDKLMASTGKCPNHRVDPVRVT